MQWFPGFTLCAYLSMVMVFSLAMIQCFENIADASNDLKVPELLEVVEDWNKEFITDIKVID